MLETFGANQQEVGAYFRRLVKKFLDRFDCQGYARESLIGIV